MSLHVTKTDENKAVHSWVCEVSQNHPYAEVRHIITCFVDTSGKAKMYAWKRERQSEVD